MSHCKTMYRLAVSALATTALASPAAFAMPIDPGTVQTPAAEQEYRSPDAIDQSAAKAPVVRQDQRSPDAVDAGPAPKPEPLPAGLPTWPVNPQTLPRPQEPVVAPTSGDGGGVDWTVPGIALAACLMLGGAFAVGRTRLRAARSSAAH